jgi:hypothetical protein
MRPLKGCLAGPITRTEALSPTLPSRQSRRVSRNWPIAGSRRHSPRPRAAPDLLKHVETRTARDKDGSPTVPRRSPPTLCRAWPENVESLQGALYDPPRPFMLLGRPRSSPGLEPSSTRPGRPAVVLKDSCGTCPSMRDADSRQLPPPVCRLPESWRAAMGSPGTAGHEAPPRG